MKKIMSCLSFFLICVCAANVWASECIKKIEELSVSSDGKTGTYAITFDVSSLIAIYSPIDGPLFSGTATWDDGIMVNYQNIERVEGWVYRVIISGWQRYKKMKFSAGVIYNNRYDAQSLNNECAPTYRVADTYFIFETMLPPPPPPSPPPPGAKAVPGIVYKLLLKGDN